MSASRSRALGQFGQAESCDICGDRRLPDRTATSGENYAPAGPGAESANVDPSREPASRKIVGRSHTGQQITECLYRRNQHSSNDRDQLNKAAQATPAPLCRGSSRRAQRRRLPMWIASPMACLAASITASPRVGCGWTVRLMSSAKAPISMANAPSLIRSLASGPTT